MITDTSFVEKCKDIRFLDTYADAGVWIINPYNEPPIANVPNGHIRTPVGQLPHIVKWLMFRAPGYGFKTVLFDGATPYAHRIKNEYARQKVNKTDKSRHYEILGSDDSILHVSPGMNWNDNGMAQNDMRYTLRDPLLGADLNFLLIGHEIAKPDEDSIGMDVGGWAAARDFGQGFSHFLYLDAKPDGDGQMVRTLYTGPFRHPKLNLTVRAKVNQRPGNSMPLAINVKENDFEHSVNIWKHMRKLAGPAPMDIGLVGGTGAGKSALMSAFLALEDSKPAVVVMADNQPSLPSYYGEVLGL